MATFIVMTYFPRCTSFPPLKSCFLFNPPVYWDLQAFLSPYLSPSFLSSRTELSLPAHL